jgi:hypothetical protein
MYRIPRYLAQLRRIIRLSKIRKSSRIYAQSRPQCDITNAYDSLIWQRLRENSGAKWHSLVEGTSIAPVSRDVPAPHEPTPICPIPVSQHTASDTVSNKSHGNSPRPHLGPWRIERRRLEKMPALPNTSNGSFRRVTIDRFGGGASCKTWRLA